MVGELSLMAVASASPVVLVPSKELQGVVHFQGRPQEVSMGVSSIQLCAQQHLDGQGLGVQMLSLSHDDGQLSYQPFPMPDRSALVESDVQDSLPDSVQFSFGIAEQCTRQEEIMKFLMSGSNVKELDVSLLSELMRCQTQVIDMSTQPYIPDDKLSICEFGLDEPQRYPPESQLFIPDPLVNFVQNLSYGSSLTIDQNGRILFNDNQDEMRDLLSIVLEFNMCKREPRGCKTALLVPYFNRKRRARANSQVCDSKLASAAIDPSKSSANLKSRSSSKKKQKGKNIKERDLYQDNYFHASEAFLSMLLDKDKESSTIFSLKKAGPEITELLTQFSIGIAGTGLAVLLSVACKMATGGRTPFPASRLLNTGVGFGLFWLSWAVNGLRDTISSIFRSPIDTNLKEDEAAVRIQKSMNDILFRAATLVALTALKFA